MLSSYLTWPMPSPAEKPEGLVPAAKLQPVKMDLSMVPLPNQQDRLMKRAVQVPTKWSATRGKRVWQERIHLRSWKHQLLHPHPQPCSRTTLRTYPRCLPRSWTHWSLQRSVRTVWCSISTRHSFTMLSTKTIAFSSWDLAASSSSRRWPSTMRSWSSQRPFKNTLTRWSTKSM